MRVRREREGHCYYRLDNFEEVLGCGERAMSQYSDDSDSFRNAACTIPRELLSSRDMNSERKRMAF
jgi:hypothetical protein